MDTQLSYVFIIRLEEILIKLRMCCARSKYVFLLQDWIGSKPNLVLAREQLVEVDRSSYVSSCISVGSNI